MLERRQIQRGVKLRSLQQIGKVAPGTVGTVDIVREPKAGWQWGFTVHWQGVRQKERYSSYFGEDDLQNFELAPEGVGGFTQGARTKSFVAVNTPIGFV